MPIKKKAKAKAEKESGVTLIDFDQTPNATEFMQRLRIMSSSAVGIILVRTKELQRAAGTIFEYAVSKGETAFHVWSITEGWKQLPTTAKIDSANADSQEYIFDLYPKNVQPNSATIAPDAAMQALIQRLTDNEQSEHSVNIMFAPDFWFEQPSTQEFLRAFSTKSLDVDARLILICHDTVVIPDRVFEEVRVMDYQPPNAVELYEFVGETLEGLDLGDGEADIELTEHDKQRIVQNALGMTYAEFTTALSVGLVEQDTPLKDGEPVNVDKLVETVLKTKVEIIKKSNILEMMKPVPIENVGGMDVLKDWIRERQVAFLPEARDYGIDMPKGILCVGPPGTGKSLVAKAIASILQTPLIGFDIGKVFGGLVGQSEGQMRSTLNLIEAMAPVVLLIDEIDKGFANTTGGGDSGTSARVFGTFLTWMQERKSQEKPVFVCMTANDVTHLPPELLRMGRLDETFAVGFPHEKERLEIFRIHLKARGHDIPEKELMEVVAATPQFVGAEIEGIVKGALLKSLNAGLPHPTSEILVNVAHDIRPLSKQFGDKIERMRKWASDNAKAASSYDKMHRGSDGPPKTSRPVIKRGARKIVRPSRGSRDN